MRGMGDHDRLTSAVWFGRGRWDPVVRRLEVDGAAVKLPWRAAECLQALLEAGVDVVPKEELEQAVWGGALVEESNLPQCITLLRKALDPAPGGGSHIETVARVGYRIAVRIEVEQEVSAAGAHPAGESAAWGAGAEPETGAAGRRPVVRRLAWAVGGLLALVAASLLTALALRQLQRAQQIDALLAEGFDLSRRGNLPSAEQASQKFGLVLKLDPSNARAMAGMAENGARTGKHGYAVAEELARRALAEDPRCGECQAVLGWVLMARGWRWGESEQALLRALAAAEAPPQAYVWRAMWLAAHRRVEEAAELARRLAAGRPYLAQARVALAMTHFFAGRYRESIEESRQALAIQPRQSAAYHWIWRSSMELGDDTGALDGRAMESVTWTGMGIEAQNALFARFHRHYGRGGRAALAQGWIDEVSDEISAGTQRYHRAVWQAWRGDHAAALEELEAGVRSRPFHMIYTAVDPAFERLRNEPRFHAVLRGIGLE